MSALNFKKGVYTRVFTYVCLYMGVYMYMPSCIYVCLYVDIYIYM